MLKDFLKKFLINLGCVALIFLIPFIFYPEIMKAVFQTYFLLFGPFAIIFIVVWSIPSRWKKSK